MQSSASQSSAAGESPSTKNESDGAVYPHLAAMSGALERLVARAADPLSGWSLQVLAQAERRAAKRLVSASTQLERAASRLDAARLKLAARREQPAPAGPNGHVHGSAAIPPGTLDEMCPPHLA